MKTRALILLAVLCAVPALAQQGGGRGGPQMSPEESLMVWKSQADHAAAELGLEGEKAAAVAKAYVDMRQAHGEEMRALRQSAQGGGGGGQFMMQQRELAEKHRKSLQDAVAKATDAATAAKVADQLGVFHRQWDPMVLEIEKFNLSDDAKGKALGHIHAYVAGAYKAQNEIASQDDFQALRQKMDELKSTLDEQIKPLVSEEQFGQWMESTRSRRGGPGGPGGQDGQRSQQ